MRWPGLEWYKRGNQANIANTIYALALSRTRCVSVLICYCNDERCYLMLSMSLHLVCLSCTTRGTLYISIHFKTYPQQISLNNVIRSLSLQWLNLPYLANDGFLFALFSCDLPHLRVLNNLLPSNYCGNF